MNELIKQVQIWAEDRNLISGATPKTQIIKLMAQIGKLADDINKQADPTDAIGDCLVVLTILAAQHNITLLDCLAHAYHQIKDRKGIMLDGVFIRDTDPQYPGALALLANRHQGAQP